MAKNSVVFFSILLVLFLVAISDIARVNGALCEKASQTWSGNCGNTGHCDNQCKTWEGAAHGACHVRGGKHMCFCYFNCPIAQMLNDKANQKKINPDVQKKINPDVQKKINPDVQKKINPDVQKKINPDVQKKINPDVQKTNP